MQFHREHAAGTNLIRSIADDRIQVGELWYSDAFVVTPDTIITDWSPPAIATLTASDLDVVWALAPELVLLGTGRSIEFPSPRVLTLGAERGIGIEVMDTAAACRTYNILATEGRKVAAALIVTAR